MTVAELIERLQAENPLAEIVVYDRDEALVPAVIDSTGQRRFWHSNAWHYGEVIVIGVDLSRQ